MRTQAGSTVRAQPFPHPAAWARFAYNLLFWVFLLPLCTPVSFGAGFVAFAGVIALRVGVNLFHNNGMRQSAEAFDRQWMRIPV